MGTERGTGSMSEYIKYLPMAKMTSNQLGRMIRCQKSIFLEMRFAAKVQNHLSIVYID